VSDGLRRARERIDPDDGTFITVAPDPIAGASGRLAGMAIAIKDLIDTAGLRTTYGARAFDDHVPQSDAAIVSQLRTEGVAIVGKTNLNEFAFGVTGYNPHYGTVVNPHDSGRTAGGSSGGSAAAVATGACDAAVGTDTSGSIRIPAACCGVYGFKARHGAFSMEGIFPLAPSYDSLGYLAPDVATLARILDVRQADDLTRVRVAALDEDVVLPALPEEHWTIFRSEAAATHHARPHRRYGRDVQLKLRNSVGDLPRARVEMAAWRATTERALVGIHVLSGPVFDGAAPTIADVLADYEQDRLSESARLMRFTPIANALGWPAMAVPTADGPRHLLARPGHEPLLLAVADRIGLHRCDVLAA
jgi:aspartyl-tRNA(Asn)/glutamyl-tRNA(Gln) amidotransferase subunit A